MAGIETISPHVNPHGAGNTRLASGPINGGDIDNVDTAESGDGGEVAATSDGAALQITLSEDAQDFLAADGESSEGPGKSAHSTAHRARAALDLEEFSTLRDLPFGKIVSTLARFGNLSSLLPPPEPATAETAGTEETGETGETGDSGETGETGDGTIAALPTDPALDEPIVTDAGLDDAALALQILQDTADSLNQ